MPAGVFSKRDFQFLLFLCSVFLISIILFICIVSIITGSIWISLGLLILFGFFTTKLHPLVFSFLNEAFYKFIEIFDIK